jgi:hypothetical protein
MMTLLVFPQSISVQVKSDEPEAATLHITEQTANAADARSYEFCVTRDDLQRLREDITTALSKGQLPE